MSLLNTNVEHFEDRHIGNNPAVTTDMLNEIGLSDLTTLIDLVVPEKIKLQNELNITEAVSEQTILADLKNYASKNKLYKNFIGQGYYGTITPSVILRNIFENPGWYTQYTPYQAEISQGRLESLLNFQTMVVSLTGLPIANASLLDEATAAAEAMTMIYHAANENKNKIFFIDESIFAQTISVLKTRANALSIQLEIGNFKSVNLNENYVGIMLQYPNKYGEINDFSSCINTAKSYNIKTVLATDLMALTLLKSPGELGVDVAIGSTQRFGVPLGFGGPHAAFFATTEFYKRNIPGRIIGISIDAQGNRALRMALQTREQHIKREKATSNICTAQALLANMAAMYAVYHGPTKIKAIAERIHTLTSILFNQLISVGYKNLNTYFFDTISFELPTVIAFETFKNNLETNNINIHFFNNTQFSISIDETTQLNEVNELASLLSSLFNKKQEVNENDSNKNIPLPLVRTSEFLSEPVFNSYHSETMMMRYIKWLENKDISLNRSMISLGSCTMKLNAATLMFPLSWDLFSKIHPFVPINQAKGYIEIIHQLETDLCTITGFDACSIQPNSGAQGEYAGLLCIKKYMENEGQHQRIKILIPVSAHGTNPASAVMAGFEVVIVQCTSTGNIDVEDLKLKSNQYKNELAGLMVTYPSTHGVFEEEIIEICDIIHLNGGLVYMDGANMNAQVGVTNPATIGADVCHLNLHKTFAIPHGGGGPGVGPICVVNKLKPYLPKHVYFLEDSNAVSAAPFGSASILLISYAYIKLLGAAGLKNATIQAILNANYMMKKLAKNFEILYTGKNGYCAHEFIIDLRPYKKSVGIEAEDFAKRLIDYGFHAPTLSFPVPGTMMIEPTESEDKAELDRFCDAMVQILQEVKQIENGQFDKLDNLLKNAPHTQFQVCADEWKHGYSRTVAAFPLPYIIKNKFWAPVARLNNTHGDRNLICTCAPIENYM